MSVDKTTAQDDLAFIRRLMSPDDDGAAQREFGKHYAIWGLFFALPLLPEWARTAGLIALPDLYWPIAAAVVTVAVIIVTVTMSRRAKPTVGVQARASHAVFGGVGWANVAVLIGLVFAATRLEDGRIMMIHAVVVFAFQGAAWYAIWALRKRAFAGIVAGGWFVCAVALGATMPTHWFVLLAALGLLGLMVLPGIVMMRTPRAA